MGKRKKISGYVPTPIEGIHEFLQEIRRGTGAPQPKKGKGSYKREKYKGGDYQWQCCREGR